MRTLSAYLCAHNHTVRAARVDTTSGVRAFFGEGEKGSFPVQVGVYTDEWEGAPSVVQWTGNIRELLETEYPVDAHVLCYSGDTGVYPPNKQLMQQVDSSKLGLQLQMVHLEADLVDHASWDQLYGQQAPQKWKEFVAAWREMLPKYPLFKSCNVYRSRGGLHFVWVLDHPLHFGPQIPDVSRLYHALESVLDTYKGFGVDCVLDKSCTQITRCMRLPNVLRDGSPTFNPFILGSGELQTAHITVADPKYSAEPDKADLKSCVTPAAAAYVLKVLDPKKRNSSFYLMARKLFNEYGCDEASVENFLIFVNQELKEPLKEEELSTTISSAFRAGRTSKHGTKILPNSSSEPVSEEAIRSMMRGEGAPKKNGRTLGHLFSTQVESQVQEQLPVSSDDDFCINPMTPDPKWADNLYYCLMLAHMQYSVYLPDAKQILSWDTTKQVWQGMHVEQFFVEMVNTLAITQPRKAKELYGAVLVEVQKNQSKNPALRHQIEALPYRIRYLDRVVDHRNPELGLVPGAQTLVTQYINYKYSHILTEQGKAAIEEAFAPKFSRNELEVYRAFGGYVLKGRQAGALVLQGKAGAGKSTMLSLLVAMLPQEAVVFRAWNSLDARFATKDLEGKRLVADNELSNMSSRSAENAFKKVCDFSPVMMSVEPKGLAAYDVQFTGSFIGTTNDMLRVHGDTTSMSDRLMTLEVLAGGKTRHNGGSLTFVQDFLESWGQDLFAWFLSGQDYRTIRQTAENKLQAGPVEQVLTELMNDPTNTGRNVSGYRSVDLLEEVRKHGFTNLTTVHLGHCLKAAGWVKKHSKAGSMWFPPTAL